MYKNYFFDLYDTLIDVETNEHDDLVWEKMALYFSYYGAVYEAQEFKERYYSVIGKVIGGNPETDYPEIDVEYVFYKLFKDKEVKPKKRMARDAAKVFRMLSTNFLEAFDGVVDMLAVLNSQKKKIFILANAQNVFAMSELRKVGIRKYFDELYFSSDYGKCKPDQDFLEVAFAAEDIKKKESIIISSDYHRDIKSAKAMGVDALFINVNPEEVQEKADCKFEVKGRDYLKIIDLLVK